MIRKFRIELIIVLAMLTGLLVGCSTKTEERSDTRSTLKVMYYDKNGYYYQYGMLFSALYPNVDVEVVSTNDINYEDGEDRNKALIKFIDEQKPDVLMLSAEQYKQLSNEGRLYDLDARAKRDKYDLDGIVPGVISYIRELSEGKLYGLSPSFYSKAVYYNKDLFTQYGVPLPEDKMSWDSLLQLAARFPTSGTGEDRIYGIQRKHSYDLYNLGTNIGSTMGLDVFNVSSMKMTINTDSWKAAFETAQKAIQSGAMYTIENQGAMSYNTYEDYLFESPFINGKIAMVVDDNGLRNQIKAAQSANKERAIKNWDIVTVPVNPQNPDVTDTMSIDQIFAIDAKSTNIEAAWKFISYVNSDEFAKVKSKINSGSLPVRTKYIKDEEGHNLQAFISLKPVEATLYKDYDKLPNEFFSQILKLTQEQLSQVTNKQQSISEALDNIQKIGQELLNKQKVIK
ncbi:ABC transporter substrate-binding protein [Cohnella abietis]|uniref:Sugar ABC transporter substrate-binding protein n=1 Tax=Cohnella abietis TaxID=2507935 RepID=A0A3T1DAA5_9BACL|nr:extracellular solute-binding protein [Cohnella abietis]BBI35015.1 hypothetical protein KCTCHS21_44140 [Cohnella abietis]